MFAIVRTGGKQYRVAAGDKIVVEKLAGNAGDKIDITYTEAMLVSLDLVRGSAVDFVEDWSSRVGQVRHEQEHDREEIRAKRVGERHLVLRHPHRGDCRRDLWQRGGDPSKQHSYETRPEPGLLGERLA